MRKKKVGKLKISGDVHTKDYEEFLIEKIDRCQKVVSGLRDNPVWKIIQEDYETTAKSLDMTWAMEDTTSPKFRQMQITKMAATTFLKLSENYAYDLEIAMKELEKFQKPHSIIKKDFDEEGIEQAPETPQKEGNQYHGR